MPAEYTSTDGLSDTPSSRSGAMYGRLPMTTDSVRASRPSNSPRAMPKSRTFTSPWIDSMMFEGLMSRWMTRSGRPSSPSASA
jgi:hypothetical protein